MTIQRSGQPKPVTIVPRTILIEESPRNPRIYREGPTQRGAWVLSYKRHTLWIMPFEIRDKYTRLNIFTQKFFFVKARRGARWRAKKPKKGRFFRDKLLQLHFHFCHAGLRSTVLIFNLTSSQLEFLDSVMRVGKSPTGGNGKCWSTVCNSVCPG